jgi:hypothetical protein
MEMLRWEISENVKNIESELSDDDSDCQSSEVKEQFTLVISDKSC